MIAASFVEFQRSKTAKLEIGIAILINPGDHDVIAMVSADGQVISSEEIWNYKLLAHYGSISLKLPYSQD